MNIEKKNIKTFWGYSWKEGEILEENSSSSFGVDEGKKFINFLIGLRLFGINFCFVKYTKSLFHKKYKKFLRTVNSTSVLYV